MLRRADEYEADRCAAEVASPHNDRKGEPERILLSPKDAFFSHRLSAEQVAQICDLLSPYPQIAKTFQVHKAVEIFPKQPFYVLGLVLWYRWYLFRTEKADRELVDRVSAEGRFPEDTLVLLAEGNCHHFQKAWRHIPDVLIYIKG